MIENIKLVHMLHSSKSSRAAVRVSRVKERAPYEKESLSGHAFIFIFKQDDRTMFASLHLFILGEVQIKNKGKRVKIIFIVYLLKQFRD